jgi:hypothetical protein
LETDGEPIHQQSGTRESRKSSGSEKKQSNPKQVDQHRTNPDPGDGIPGELDLEENNPPISEPVGSKIQSKPTTNNDPGVIKCETAENKSKSGSVTSNPDRLDSQIEETKPVKLAQKSQAPEEKKENTQRKKGTRNIFDMLSDCQEPAEHQKVSSIQCV